LQHILDRRVSGIVAQDHERAMFDPLYPGRARELLRIEMGGLRIG